MFIHIPNTSSRTSYFFWQVPESLWNPRLYERLTLGLLAKDRGPLAGVLILWGMLGAAMGRRTRGRCGAGRCCGSSSGGPARTQGAGPRLLRPADSACPRRMGALGWRLAVRHASWLGVVLLILAAVVHSPWVMIAKYDQEVGHMVVAEHLKTLCTPGGRIARSGPADRLARGPLQRPPGLGRGIRHAACGLAREVPEIPRVRSRVRSGVFRPNGHTRPAGADFAPVLGSLPVVEHRSGPWYRGGRPAEYYILDLRDSPADVAVVPRTRR